MNKQHEGLASGGWGRFSLNQQLGNVGSEVSRALRWRDKEPKLFEGAMVRALELLDLTIADPRWRGRLKEILRAREVLGGAWLGGQEQRTDLAGLERYFFHFAMASAKGK